MKKLLRFFVRLLLGVLVLVLVFAGVVWWRSNGKLQAKHEFAFKASPLPASSPEVLAQGKHLAETRGCADCHNKDLGGKTVMNNGAMGHIDAPNLTHGQGGLPSSYSDADWERAIRHGVTPEGRGLFLMPATDYAPFSESDMGALIVYLKSLPPVDRQLTPVKLGPVARGLLAFGKIKLAADEIDHAALKPEVATPGATVEYGKYLATSCTGCHGPNYSGGKIAAGPPEWPPAANLTPDSAGRLAKWTETDFIKTLRTAKRPDGTELHTAMPRAFGQMTDMELKAIWLFLKTVPAAVTGSR